MPSFTCVACKKKFKLPKLYKAHEVPCVKADRLKKGLPAEPELIGQNGELVSRKVSMFWPEEKAWFEGILSHFDPEDKSYTVRSLLIVCLLSCHLSFRLRNVICVIAFL